MAAQGAAFELSAKHFGGQLNEVERSLQVGVTAESVVSGDPERVSLLLVNLSVADMYIGLTPDVSSKKGIWLGPNGGSFSLDATTDGTLMTRQFYVIAGLAASDLYILELRREVLTPQPVA